MLHTRTNTLLGVLLAAVSTMLGPSVVSLQPHASTMMSRPVVASHTRLDTLLSLLQKTAVQGTLCHVHMQICNVG